MQQTCKKIDDEGGRIIIIQKRKKCLGQENRKTSETI